MPAHIIFSALDPDLPATVSAAILDGFLRREMGFGGLAITDAMDMYAVNRFGAVESVRMALDAGIDLALLGHLQDQFAIRDAVQDCARPEALARIQAAREAAPHDLLPLDVVGCAEHQQIAQTIADQSITLVRDAGRLPLRSDTDQTIMVITPEPANLTPADSSSEAQIALADAIRRRHPKTRALELPHNASDSDISAVVQQAANADIVIVGTIAADQQPPQAALVRALHALGKTPIVIALRTPYDLIAFPEIKTYLCAYSIRDVSTEAVARVLFGEILARGVLPCPIPGLAEMPAT
jgi:beta-N-acetylhexosaminidase